MRHLNADELVDIAEGAETPAAAAHIRGCGDCRRQLNDLRTMMSVAAESAVPEPSPLYWDHLSRRVRDAVAIEAAQPHGGPWSWFTSVFRPGFAMSMTAAALAALLLAVVITMRGGGSLRPNGQDAGSAEIAAVPFETDPLADDASIGLVADLAADMDLQTAQDAGLAAGGSADHAVTHLTAAELRELNRLLKEALAKPGA